MERAYLAAAAQHAESGDFGALARYLHACERAGAPPIWSRSAVLAMVQLAEARAAQRRGGAPADAWRRYRALREGGSAAPGLTSGRFGNRYEELAERGSETRRFLARFVRHARAVSPAARPHLRALMARQPRPAPGAAAAVLCALGALGAAPRSPRAAAPARLAGPFAFILSPAGLASLAVLVLALGLAWQLAHTVVPAGSAPLPPVYVAAPD
jgi:hypothetical protein